MLEHKKDLLKAIEDAKSFINAAQEVASEIGDAKWYSGGRKNARMKHLSMILSYDLSELRKPI